MFVITFLAPDDPQMLGLDVALGAAKAPDETLTCSLHPRWLCRITVSAGAEAASALVGG